MIEDIVNSPDVVKQKEIIDPSAQMDQNKKGLFSLIPN